MYDRGDTGRLMEIDHAKNTMNLNPIQEMNKTR